MPTKSRSTPTQAPSHEPVPVSQVMTRNPIAVAGSETLRELARLLTENEISGVPVVDAQERVIGVISRTDLVLQLLQGPEGSVPKPFLESIAGGLAYGSDAESEEFGTISDYMNPEPITVTPETPVSEVAHLMAEERVHRIIVVDDGGHLLGIVTTLDVLSVFPS